MPHYGRGDIGNRLIITAMNPAKIQLNLTCEELEQLTRMIYLAQYVIDSSADVYEHKAAMKTLMEKVFQLGYEHIPVSGLCQKSLDDEPDDLYSHTIKMEEEAEPVLQAFCDDVFYECISNELAWRDFKEKYGYVSSNTLWDNPVLNDYLESLKDFYLTELAENGLLRMRVTV